MKNKLCPTWTVSFIIYYANGHSEHQRRTIAESLST